MPPRLKERVDCTMRKGRRALRRRPCSCDCRLDYPVPPHFAKNLISCPIEGNDRSRALEACDCLINMKRGSRL